MKADINIIFKLSIEFQSNANKQHSKFIKIVLFSCTLMSDFFFFKETTRQSSTETESLVAMFLQMYQSKLNKKKLQEYLSVKGHCLK